MKSFVLTLISTLVINLQAQAAETVISSRIVNLPVDISLTKVVLTNAGYGTTYLVKVLVPALAEPTLMNHRNEGESAPCLATYETNKIEEIVQNNPEIINVDMKIDLIKLTSISDEDQLCHVFLTENITTKIRGYNFRHFRTSEMPTRAPTDCQ